MDNGMVDVHKVDDNTCQLKFKTDLFKSSVPVSITLQKKPDGSFFCSVSSINEEG